MPRKSSVEKVNETAVEKPATRRSARLSTSSPQKTPQQTRTSSRKTGAKATPPGSSSSSSSASKTTASPKTSGKKDTGSKTSTPKRGSRGKGKGHKESEEKEEEREEEETVEQEEHSEQAGKDVDQDVEKGQKGGRKSRENAKEKGEAADTKSNSVEESLEETKETTISAGRPRRGKQPVTPVSTKPSTPQRCGRSRGKDTEGKSGAGNAAELDSTPRRGAKRKIDDVGDKEMQGKDEPKEETSKSPKMPELSSAEEKEEVEKMDVDTVDHEKVEAKDSKEEKMDETLENAEKSQENVKPVDESGSSENIKSEEDQKPGSTSQDMTVSDVKENGLETVIRELPDSDVSLTAPTSEPASSVAKTEEAVSNGTNDASSNDDLLARKFVWFGGNEPSPSKLAQSFSIASYNILADYHAQRDYTGPKSWITKDHLSMDYRHSLLMKEFRFLDCDIICLQEVDTDYFTHTLKPALAELGYDGVHVPRHTTAFSEGEATFFRTKCFTLEASQSLVLSQVAEREIEETGIEADVKSSVKESVDSHAVTLLTRFKCVNSDSTITCANIHVAYDKFERQDKQCLQLACAIRELVKFAGGPDEPHFICGDFNSWPDSPPYQLVRDGHLSEKSLTALQSINSINQADGQMAPLVNYWSEGFQYSPADNLLSSYLEVLGQEPLTSRFNCDGVVRSVDYVWFSGNSLEVMGVLETVKAEKIKDGVPNTIFPSDHLSLKAILCFK